MMSGNARPAAHGKLAACYRVKPLATEAIYYKLNSCQNLLDKG